MHSTSDRAFSVRRAFRAIVVLAGILVLALSASATTIDGTSNAGRGSSPLAPALSDPQDVIAYLKQTVEWYRRLALEQQYVTEPGDFEFVNGNRQLAEEVVRLAFEFALTDAQRYQVQGTAAQDSQVMSTSSKYQALVANAEGQIKELQGELDSRNKLLATSSGRKRLMLQSQITETQSELRLQEARRDAIGSMLQFIGNSGGTGIPASNLTSQIEEIERALPPGIVGAKAKVSELPATSAASVSASSGFATPAVAGNHAPSSGILALIGNLRALLRKQQWLDGTIQSTNDLRGFSQKLRTARAATLRQAIRRSNEIANQPDSTDPAVLAQQTHELDNLTAQFKQSIGVVLPLSKQSLLLDLNGRNLGAWRDATHLECIAALKELALRVSVLVIVLGLVVVASEFTRRAIFRYVRDIQRRHQLLLLRRIVVLLIFAIVITFAFSTDFGSIATFAGLITAGVALALQNVLISVVGYFFLIGKYGVRVGDRVEISGVKGEVLDIGMVRLHVAELTDTGSGARATGRVVGFSNSVVFQTDGSLFRQIPGTNFGWHEIMITLVSGTDFRIAEQRMEGAVRTVFAEYQELFDRQRHHLERTLSSASIAELGPQTRLRFTSSGLEVAIRYPVLAEKAAELNDRMTRELLDAMACEPKLEFAKLENNGKPSTAAGAAMHA